MLWIQCILLHVYKVSIRLEIPCSNLEVQEETVTQCLDRLEHYAPTTEKGAKVAPFQLRVSPFISQLGIQLTILFQIEIGPKQLYIAKFCLIELGVRQHLRCPRYLVT